MRIKKFLCAAIASAMVLSASVCAFAEAMIKITFVPKDGNNPYSIEEVKGNPLHELPVPDMDGTREFMGWYTDEDGTSVYDIDAPVTEDFTLYAIWKETVLPFTDVAETDSFADDIKYVYLNNLMYGTTDSAFAPNETLTRGMLVTILHRSEGEPVVNYAMRFADVEQDMYYAEPIRWAQASGIVYGITETEFAPDENLTRAQLAAIMYRYADYKNLDLDKLSEDTNTLSYDDITDIPSWAASALHATLATGILEGRGNNIAPNACATRAEAAHAIRIEKTIADSTYLSPLSKEYLSYEGDFADSYSQRATMFTHAIDKDSMLITVIWSSSAWDYTQWDMTADFTQDGKLVYSDERQTKHKVSDSGEDEQTVVYENKEGYFTLDGGKLLWDGAYDENCKNCVFEVVTI